MPRSHETPDQGITDPVTGFTYPEAWVAACRSREDLDLTRAGLAVLTSSGIVLKRGYTTGTTAAACCKAAILSLGGAVGEVEVATPCGLRVRVPVEAAGGEASCRKYPGDYPGDSTAEIRFIAQCTPSTEGISISPGEGIGRFVRKTPRYRKGDPAISPPALASILSATREGMAAKGLSGISIHLSIPEGIRVAERTLNPQVGIEGGISILGTTGLVEPWDDHLAETVLERVRSSDRVVLSTGRTGLRYSRLLFPDHEAILAGSYLKEAVEAAGGSVILCGLPALILKFLDPDLPGSTGYATIEEFTTDPAFRSRMLSAFAKGKERYPSLRIVIVTRDGTVMGDSG